MATKEKQKSRLHMTCAQNDARYVDRGTVPVLRHDKNAATELAEMNRKKNGRPFAYPETLIVSIAIIRTVCGLSCRACEGLAQEALGEGDAPDSTTLQKRISKVGTTLVNGHSGTARSKASTVRVIPDGTGLTPGNRGEWIRKTHKLRRGSIRLSVMIDRDTREILAFRISDEKTGDMPQLKGLIDDTLENLEIDPEDLKAKKHDSSLRPLQSPHDGQQAPASDSDGEPAAAIPHDGQQAPASDSDGEPAAAIPPDVEMRADGGYDSREAFSYCDSVGITPHIRIRTNAGCRARGVDRGRPLRVIDQLGGNITNPREFAALGEKQRERDRKEWKKTVGYGGRWNVEIVFSAFKRIFGNSVSAVKMKNIVHEIKLKIAVYNRLLCMAQEAILRV